MNRRGFLIAVSAAVLLAGTSSARADFVDDVVEWLEEQGFTQITITRTLLGRVHILASNDKGTRDMVLNPRTGEVLRDVWLAADGKTTSPYTTLPPAHDDRSGPGGGSDDDDDGDDGDDDDD